MAVRIYDDEYQVGWLCKAWLTLPPSYRAGGSIPCRRPRGHEGEHQNKRRGWKWWHDTEGELRKLPIGEEEQCST